MVIKFCFSNEFACFSFSKARTVRISRVIVVLDRSHLVTRFVVGARVDFTRYLNLPYSREIITLPGMEMIVAITCKLPSHQRNVLLRLFREILIQLIQGSCSAIGYTKGERMLGNGKTCDRFVSTDSLSVNFSKLKRKGSKNKYIFVKSDCQLSLEERKLIAVE